MKNGIKSLAVWLIFLIIFIVLISSIMDNSSNKLAYSELLADMEKGTVTSIEIQDGGEKALVELEGDSVPKEVNIPDINSFMTYAQEILKTNSYTLTERPESVFMKGLYLIIPFGIIVIVLLFGLLLINPGNQGGNKTMSFGKSKARMTNGAEKTKVTFNDVAGVDEEKEELEEIVEFLKTPKKFTDMGARIPKGVLLVGQPGTGKTLLAKAVAGEAGVPFFSISGSEFVEMFVGVGASRVRDLFAEAKAHAPCIIFIDELDAVGRHRGAGVGGGHDEREQTLNQLLVEMDGFEDRQSVIVMAATNRVDILDPALLRPGRFDRQIVVGSPDIGAREKILELHAKKKPFASDIDFKVIAKNTAGFSGADLENMINEATILATRKNKKIVEMEDVEEAMVKVMMGPEKKSKIISDKEKRLTAYHEAGHAVVSRFLPNHDTVHQISIIPRGMAGGYTMYKPNEDKSFMSMTEMKENIVSLLGGRVAEKLVLNDISTGASNDIERASKIARDMVTKYGMSDKLGPITFGETQEEVFLGMERNNGRNYSEKVAAQIDEEVGNIINGGYKYAEKLLKENIDKLHKVAEILIEKEKISAEEFEAVFNQ